MKKYFILIAMVAVSVSAADKNNASDEYYTCHMSKQLDRTSKAWVEIISQKRLKRQK